MKRSELLFTVVQVPLDFLALVSAAVVAYVVRFSSFFVALKAPQFSFEASQYAAISMAVAVVWLILFAFAGLYTVNPNRKLVNDVGRIILACSTGLALVTSFIFFRGELFNSRFIVLVAWVLAMVFVIASHTIMKLIRIALYRIGVGARKVVIVGSTSVAQTLGTFLEEHKSLGYHVAKTVPAFDGTGRKSIEELHKEGGLDEIIFVPFGKSAQTQEAIACIEWCTEHQITFKYSADLFTTLSANMAISTVAGIPIVELKKTRLEGWGSVVKLMVDVVGAVILVVLTSPIMLVTAVAILIESGRPVLFKNERVGKRGRVFATLKFRSMYQQYCIGPQFKNQKKALDFEAELIKKQNTKEGPLYKIKDDPRVTKVGKFIRRFSIDELPQFFNVLNGTMSLVGPRPHQPREVAQYEKNQKVSFHIKPGITGLAQISGRSDLDFEEEVRLDAFYTERWSLIMDLIILLKTPFALLKKRKAL